MPPDLDAEYVHAIVNAVVALVRAVELGASMLEIIAALNALLVALTERGTVSSRRAEALARALARLD